MKDFEVRITLSKNRHKTRQTKDAHDMPSTEMKPKDVTQENTKECISLHEAEEIENVYCRKAKEAHAGSLFHSSYIKLVLFIILLGCLPCGISIYLEVKLLFSPEFPHLSYSLMHMLAIGLSSTLNSLILPHMGRRRPLIYSTVCFIPAIIVNAIYQTHHAYDLLVRFLAGISTGGFLTCALVYIGELPLPAYRAKYCCLLGAAYWFGALLYFILFHYSPLLSLVMLLFLFLFLILALIYLPESPSYVMYLGHEHFASEVLYFLRCGPIRQQQAEIHCWKMFIVDHDKKCLHPCSCMLDRCLTSMLLIYFVQVSALPMCLLTVQMKDGMGLILIASPPVVAFIFCYCSIGCARSCVVGTSVTGVLLANVALTGFWILAESDTEMVDIGHAVIALFFLFYFAGLSYLVFVLMSEIFPYRSKCAHVGFGVFMYLILFSFGGFMTRMLCMSLGPQLTMTYFLVNSIIGAVFFAQVMPRFGKLGVWDIEGYFDAHDI